MCLLSTEMDTEASPGSAWTLQRALDTEQHICPRHTQLHHPLSSGRCCNQPGHQICECGDSLLHVFVLGAGGGRGCIWVQVEAQAVAEAGAARRRNGVVRQGKARQERAGWRSRGARGGVRSCSSIRKRSGGVDHTGR